jgi:hypothetical protein
VDQHRQIFGGAGRLSGSVALATDECDSGGDEYQLLLGATLTSSSATSPHSGAKTYKE